MMKCLGQSLKLKVLLFLVAMVFFASCHQHTVELACKQALTNEAVAEDSGGIFITVANFINQPHRTVAPDQLAQLTGYELILSGTSGRMDLPERQLTLSNGTVTIEDVPEGLWELTLKAKATGTTATNGASVGDTILEGKTVARVHNGSITDVEFTLKPLEAGNGSFQITVNIDQQNLPNLITDRSIQKTYIGLYEKGTTTLVNGFPKDNYGGRHSLTSVKYPIRGGARSLPAGEYELRVEFTLYEKVSAMWQEDVIIEPGRLTDGPVTVPHILKTPIASTWPTNAISPVSTVDNGLFEATLNWNPATNDFNTTSYEIQLKKLPDGDTRTANVRTEADFEGISGAPIIINGDPNSPHHFSKYVDTYPVSLAEGITTFDRTTDSLKLSLVAGRYVYRMRSIGHSGQQRWTYGANVLMPLPSAPVIPADYYVTAPIGTGTDFSATIKWEPVEFATSFEIHSMAFVGSPNPNYEHLLDDNTFQHQFAWTTTNPDSFFFNKLSAGRPVLLRVRAVNVSGYSAWTYYPTYLTKDGPWPTP